MEVRSNSSNKFGLSKKKIKRISDGRELLHRVMDDQSPKKKAKMLSDSFSSMENIENNAIPDSPKKKKVSPISKPVVKVSPKKQRLKLTNSAENNDISQSEVLKSPSKKMSSTFLHQSEESCSDFEEETSNYQSFSKPAPPLNNSMSNDLKPVETSEGDIFGWPMEEMVTLINNIMKVVPAKDRLKFQVRSKRIDWSQVVFGDHSADECCQQWSKLEPHIRPFRTMKEILTDALKWLESPTMPSKKDFPDMPKKPLSTYMLFVQERRDKIVKKYPGKSSTDYAKLFGEKYNALPEEKKAAYAEKSKQLSLEYKEQMKTYMQSHPEVASLMLKRKKVHTRMKPMEITKPPKKPLSAFRLYVSSNSLKDNNMSNKEFIEKMKIEWKQLSSKKKIPWIKKSKENETEYLEKLKTFVEEHPEIPVGKHKSILSKTEEEILDKLDGKPETPPRTAYGLFSSGMLKDEMLKESVPSFTERLKEISKLWQMVPEKEKELYTNQVIKMNDDYKENYKKYLNSLSPEKRAQVLSKNNKLKQTSLFDSFLTKNIQETNLKQEEGKESDDDNNDFDDDNDDDDDDNNDFDDDDDDDDNHDDLVQEEVEKIKKKLIANQPAPPPKSAFEVYKKHYLDKKPGVKESKIKMKWNSLTKHHKSKYNKEYEKLKSNYLLKFQKFIGGLNPTQVRIFRIMEQKAKE